MYEEISWISLIASVLSLILFLIILFAILKITENTIKTNQLLRILLKWQVEGDKTEWEKYWKNFKEEERKAELSSLSYVEREKILEKERKEREK